MIVVTGAGGFIGRRVVAQLAARPGRVIAVGRRAPEAPPPPSAEWRLSTDADPLGWLSNLDSFVLVHCAWCPPVRDRWTPHAEQIRNLAALLDAAGGRLERVVGVGSAEEYGPRSGRLREEDSGGDVTSAYGWGKQCARRLVQSWSDSRERPGFWLRPFTVYGEGQAGNMVLPYAVRQALARQPARFSDGLQRRDFVHVDDVARALVAAADVEARGFADVNIGTGTTHAVREVLERLARALGAEGLFEFGAIPRRATDPDEQCADVARASRLLGWGSSVDIEEGVRRLFANGTR